MIPDPDFADAAEEAPVDSLSPEEEDSGGQDDMVLLDSADDLPAYRPDDPPEPEPEAPDEGDDPGLQFSDSAPATARHGPGRAGAPPGRRPRPPSGRQPPQRRTPGGTRRPSGRLRKGPPRGQTPSQGSRRDPVSGSEQSSGSGRRRRMNTESGRQRLENTASGRQRLANTASGRQRLENTASGRQRLENTASGRHRLSQSATGRRRRASGGHGASSASSADHRVRGRAERPERSPADADAALAALEARITSAPGNDPFLGRDLGPFKVQSFIEIDRGERRYVAIHEETKAVCYLRVFPFVGSYGDEFKRVADRGERASRVENPHLDLTLGVGRTKECFFVGTRPPWGTTLAEKLAGDSFKEEEVLEVIEQVGRGLKGLHGREMFHAHLSLNVIREESPGYYVVHGSGLARPRAAFSFLSAGGDVLGWPGYIAPETVDTGGRSRSADIYSLGCVAWTLLAGKPPFDAGDEVQLLLDQLNRDVARLDAVGVDISPGVATLVGKMAGYTVDSRYSDTTELLNDVRGHRQGEAVKPFDKGGQQDALEGASSISTGTTLMIVLLLLNLAVLGFAGMTWLKADSIPLEDPLSGYELPVVEAPEAP